MPTRAQPLASNIAPWASPLAAQPPVARLAPERVRAAFEHNITWEDDIWRADPVDVELVHAEARRKFADLLAAATAAASPRAQSRILLFHGQSGAGKTHLIRALRTSAHRAGKAYFGYAQMSPDVANYADYYLRRLIASLEKPYDPDHVSETEGETALTRLTRRLTATAGLAPADIAELADAALGPEELARLVLRLADEAAASPGFADEQLDINIIRALLYLQRNDPRIDQRVRQYLYGRPLNALSHQAVLALDSNAGQDRSFEIIEGLGKLMWTVDRASLVFCIDQVEDLRFFEDPEERFQRAVRDLIQIANRVPSAIVVISCLGDFYTKAREVLAQSYIDRIERAGPVHLAETRSAMEARLIIAKRLQAGSGDGLGGGLSLSEAEALFAPQFYEEFTGLSPRRLLETAQTRCQQQLAASANAAPKEDATSFISTLAAALGFGLSSPAADQPNPLGQAFGAALGQLGGASPAAPVAGALPGIDYREPWERFVANSQAEIPTEDRDLLDVLTAGLGIVKDEWPG